MKERGRKKGQKKHQDLSGLLQTWLGVPISHSSCLEVEALGAAKPPDESCIQHGFENGCWIQETMASSGFASTEVACGTCRQADVEAWMTALDKLRHHVQVVVLYPELGKSFLVEFAAPSSEWRPPW